MRRWVRLASAIQSAHFMTPTALAIVIPDNTFYLRRILVNKESGGNCQILTFIPAAALSVICMHRLAAVFKRLINADGSLVTLAEGPTKIYPLMSPPVFFWVRSTIELMASHSGPCLIFCFRPFPRPMRAMLNEPYVISSSPYFLLSPVRIAMVVANGFNN
jgi:hypothetical protein